MRRTVCDQVSESYLEAPRGGADVGGALVQSGSLTPCLGDSFPGALIYSSSEIVSFPSLFSFTVL
jgi:hypothetical protein